VRAHGAAGGHGVVGSDSVFPQPPAAILPYSANTRVLENDISTKVPALRALEMAKLARLASACAFVSGSARPAPPKSNPNAWKLWAV
jgi:hypothetical protein